MLRFLGAATLLVCLAHPAQAQEGRVLVRVRDTQGIPVPYALVQQPRGATRVASDSGVAEFRAAPADSLRFVVRRVGFTPFEGWLRVDSSGAYAVALEPLARMLTVVNVNERAKTPLAATGFYDRLERATSGAISARFISPEELDMRNPPRVSNILAGEQLVRVNHSNGKVLLTGRGRNTCPMTVLLDGRRVLGMVEEVYSRDAIKELADLASAFGGPDAMARANEAFIRQRMSVDELVNASAVSAIEIYASGATVPAELARFMAPEHCGLIALWTGARQ